MPKSKNQKKSKKSKKSKNQKNQKVHITLFLIDGFFNQNHTTNIDQETSLPLDIRRNS